MNNYIEDFFKEIQNLDVKELRLLCDKNSFDTKYATSKEIWLALVCAQIAPYRDNYSIMNYIRCVVHKQVYWENLNIYYGIPLLLVLQLYYYNKTNDQTVLENITHSIERIISTAYSLELYILKKEDYTACKLLLYILVVLTRSVKNKWYRENVCIYLDKEINFGTTTISSFLESSGKTECKLNSFEKHLRLQYNDFTKYICKIIKEISFDNICLELSENRLCKEQLKKVFSRTLSKRQNINWASYFKGNAEETCIYFIHKFTPLNTQEEALFALEKERYFYKKELIRDISIQKDKAKNESYNSLDILSLDDDTLTNLQFKCSENVKILNLSYYESYEIEENVNAQSSHTILLKPSYCSTNSIDIKEYQLEEDFKLIKYLYQEHAMISPQALSTMITGNYEEGIKRKFSINLIRKLILQKLLVKVDNAEVEKL